MIDLCILQGRISNANNTSLTTDDETELFTGAPLRGHVPATVKLHRNVKQIQTITKPWFEKATVKIGRRNSRFPQKQFSSRATFSIPGRPSRRLSRLQKENTYQQRKFSHTTNHSGISCSQKPAGNYGTTPSIQIQLLSSEWYRCGKSERNFQESVERQCSRLDEGI